VEHRRPIRDRIEVELPTDVAARVHLNENKPFRFRLAAGDYVLVGTYDGDATTQTIPVSVTVPPTTTVHRNIASSCKSTSRTTRPT
jgi:hypothetical protein